MKRKQLAKRVAIAMLSAATVMTATPVGAFAATNVVSVDASDANAYGSQTVTTDNGVLKTLLSTKLAGVTSNTTVKSLKSNAESDDIAHYLNDNGSIDNLTLTDSNSKNYVLSNFKIRGTPTAPSFKTTAGGGVIVMPVITVKADVEYDSNAFGIVTFTLDTTELTKSEKIDAAKAVIEAAGGKAILDPALAANARTTYSNADNSSSLAGFVNAILASTTNTSISNLSVLKTGTNELTAEEVTQGTTTPATKTSAGSEVVNIKFKTTLTYADDSKDAKWDKTKAATTNNAAQDYEVTASYTATIPKIGTTAADSDYQSKVEAALATVKLTNADFNNDTTKGGAVANWVAAAGAGHTSNAANAKVKKALDSVGLEESTNNVSITYRSLTKATHSKDGSVQVLLDQRRDNDVVADEHEYATVTVPVVHADDVTAVEGEVSNKLATTYAALKADSKDIVLTSLDTTEQKKTVKAGIEKAVNDALTDTLGGTNTVASEVKKVEVALGSTFGAASTTGKGTADYTVTVTFKDDVPSALTTGIIGNELTGAGATGASANVSGNKVTYTFSPIDLYHVDGVKATGISLNDEYVLPYAKGEAADQKVTVTPKFTPANANDYTIRWSLSGDDKDKFVLKKADGTSALDAGGTTTAEGVTVKAASAAVDAGKEVTLKAELIDSDNLVAATATTTVKVVNGFSDVQNSHDYAYTAINELAEEFSVKVDGKWAKTQVIAGIGDNKFNPDGDVTRAQFVTFLYRLAQKDTNRAAKTASVDEDNKENGTVVHYDGTTDPVTEGTWVDFSNAKAQTKFTDVDSNAYYAKAVDWAVANGIASGTSDTTFSPNKVVTRAQAVAFLQRYFAAGQQYNVAAKFDDVKSTDYFAQAVSWATATGVTQGKDDNHFAPNDTTSRKEAAAFIYRAFSYNTGTSKVNR